MLHRIKNHLQNRQSYWNIISFLERKVKFKLFRRLFLVRHAYREEHISWVILRKSLGAFIKTGIYAAISIFLIEHFSYLAKDVNFTLGSEQLGLLLSTVVTISGVFFGLYFTALSAVAGSHFIRAPKNLQLLFINDRANNQYIRTLALTTVIGVYYLVLRSFGYQVSFLGPIIIAILALYVVVRFIAIGFRAFYFIHPGEGSSTLTSDARDMIDSASAGSLGWDKTYLQNQYRVQAADKLEALKSLVKFGVDVVKLSEQQLVEIAKYAGVLLDYYLEHKKRIPKDSRWFTDKQQHQNWLLADSSELIMALNTGTTLAPKTLKDNLWFENECLDVVFQIFQILVEQKKWDYAPACIEIIVYASEQIADNLYIDEAKAVLERIQKIVDPIIKMPSSSLSDYERKGQLALIDGLGRFSTGLLVGLIKHLDKESGEVLRNLQNISWVKRESVYHSDMPGQMLTELEGIKKGIDIERGMEGHQLSPDWYTSTRTAQAYLRSVKEFYELLKSMNQKVFGSTVEALIEEDNHIHAAHLTERWLEFSSKMFTCNSLFKKLIDSSESMKKVHDLPWTELDVDAEKTSLQENDKLANDKLVELLPVLAALPQSDLFELPDYFGQAYTFGVMAAYQAANENDHARLKKIFPAILIGALKAHEFLLNETKGWSEKSRIIFSTEPLEDILVLSGFIKIYSELYDNDSLWEACRIVWDKYLSGTNAKATVETLVAFTSYRDGVYNIMPKATLRHNWDISLREKLEELNIAQEPLGDPARPRNETVDHPSPLIRVIARHSALMTFDARTIFYITYLSKHEAAEGVDFPDRRELEQMLNREEGREDEEQT